MVIHIFDNIRCFYDGYLDKACSRLQYLVQIKKHQSTLIIDGCSGSGKSTIGVQICKRLDPTFCLDRIVFTPKQFIDALQAAEPTQAILFDESMVLSSRNAMSSWNKEVIQIMSMIRSKQLYIIFILPAFFDLDRNLVLFKVDALIHCYLKKYRRGSFCIYNKKRMKELYILGKKFYSYAKPMPNLRGRFSSKFVIDYDSYDKKKQEAIGNITKVAGLGKRESKFKKQRDEMIKSIYGTKKYTMTEVGKLCGGISGGEVCKIISGEH